MSRGRASNSSGIVMNARHVSTLCWNGCSAMSQYMVNAYRVMARNMQGNSALRGRSSAAISRAGTRWEGAAFSISIANNKAGDVSLLRLAMPPCLHVIRESTIKRKKDEP